MHDLLRVFSRKTRTVAIWMVLTLSVNAVYGQDYEPLDLAQRIFSRDSFPDIEKYITGEYEGTPNGQDFLENLRVEFRMLGQAETDAVVAMSLVGSTGDGIDIYLYFKKDSVWKLSAIRALAMMGMMREIKVEMEQMTLEQVDDHIAKSQQEGEFSLFTSRDDYNFQLGSFGLVLELDDNIINHFKANEAEFERLKDLAVVQLKDSSMEADGSIELIENLKSDYQKLFIAAVSTNDYELGNGINFLIGGILDNTVGYLYVRDEEDLPKMNPSRVIMIRKMDKGWYLYKTT